MRAVLCACALAVSLAAKVADAPPAPKEFDMFDPETWPLYAVYAFGFLKLLVAFSPIIALCVAASPCLACREEGHWRVETGGVTRRRRRRRRSSLPLGWQSFTTPSRTPRPRRSSETRRRTSPSTRRSNRAPSPRGCVSRGLPRRNLSSAPGPPSGGLLPPRPSRRLCEGRGLRRRQRSRGPVCNRTGAVVAATILACSHVPNETRTQQSAF